MARVQRKLLAGRRGAQSMVEFALTLPILLLVMFALIEAGRLLFYYSSVFTASREGARYGAAGGLLDDGSAFRYQDCAGIRAAARRVGFFAISSDAQIEIKYDRGPDDPRAWSALPNCSSGYTVSLGDRVVVRVTSTYTTLVPLLNFSGLTVQSLTGRTILKDIEVGGVYAPIGGGSGGGGGGGGSTPTPTASPTATTSGGGGGGGGSTPTATPTPTPTPTATPDYCGNITISSPVVSSPNYTFSLTNNNSSSTLIESMKIDWGWNGNPKNVMIVKNTKTIKSSGEYKGVTINTWNTGSDMTLANGVTTFVLTYSGGNGNINNTIGLTIYVDAGCSVSVP